VSRLWQLTLRSASWVWSKPRAASLALQPHGQPECSWVLLIDADAAVNALLDVGVGPLIAAMDRGSARGIAPDVLAACHGLGGLEACEGCRCTAIGSKCTELEQLSEVSRWAECAAEAEVCLVHGTWQRRLRASIRSLTVCSTCHDVYPRCIRDPNCMLNTGVMLIRNTATARSMMRWWAAAGDGMCPVHGQSAAIPVMAARRAGALPFGVNATHDRLSACEPLLQV
jgi:hypothetical protein